jgi:hypothetical protein
LAQHFFKAKILNKLLGVKYGKLISSTEKALPLFVISGQTFKNEILKQFYTIF